jgi:hypothetical protein
LCHTWNKSFYDLIYIGDRDLDPMNLSVKFYYPHTDTYYYYNMSGLIQSSGSWSLNISDAFVQIYCWYVAVYKALYGCSGWYDEFRPDYISNVSRDGMPDLGWTNMLPVDFSIANLDFFLYDYPYIVNVTVTETDLYMDYSGDVSDDYLKFGFGNLSEDIVNWSNMEYYITDLSITNPTVFTDLTPPSTDFTFKINYVANNLSDTSGILYDCRVDIFLKSESGFLIWKWYSDVFDISNGTTKTISVPYPNIDDYPYYQYEIEFMIPYNVSFWVIDFDNDTCICEVGRNPSPFGSMTGYINDSGIFYRFINFRFDGKKTLPMVLDSIGEGMIFFFIILIIVVFLMMGFGIAYMSGVTPSAPYMSAFGFAGLIVCVGLGLLAMWWIALIVAILICGLVIRYIASMFVEV